MTDFPKGTVSRDIRPFLLLKSSTWAPYEQAKMVSRNFSFFVEIFDCKVRKLGVRVVNDYADTRFFLNLRYVDFHIFKSLLLDV